MWQASGKAHGCPALCSIRWQGPLFTLKWRMCRYKAVTGRTWYTASHGVAQISKDEGVMLSGETVQLLLCWEAQLCWEVLSAAFLLCSLGRSFFSPVIEFLAAVTSPKDNQLHVFLCSYWENLTFKLKTFSIVYFFMLGHSQKNSSIFVANLINIFHVAIMKAQDKLEVFLESWAWLRQPTSQASLLLPSSLTVQLKLKFFYSISA